MGGAGRGDFVWGGVVRSDEHDEWAEIFARKREEGCKVLYVREIVLEGEITEWRDVMKGRGEAQGGGGR